MLRFYYDPKYKYSNRTIIDVTGDGNYKDIDYENIDSPDTINGHIIYILEALETVPTYIVENNTRRWFVSGITQLRSGKFQISLLRDLISESEMWKDEQAYVHAGLASDFNKYKTWNLPFTNTKISETRLNFSGKSSFFVFYVNENTGNNGEINEADLNIQCSTIPGVSSPDITVTNLNELPHYDLFGNNLDTLDYLEANLGIRTGRVFALENSTDLLARYTKYEDQFNIEDSWFYPAHINIATRATSIFTNANNCKEDLKTAIKNFTNNYMSDNYNFVQQSYIDDLNNLKDKIVFDSTANKYYRVHAKELKFESYSRSFTEVTGASLISAIRNINFPQNASLLDENFSVVGKFFYINFTKAQKIYWLEDLGTGTTFDFTFPASVQKLSKSSVRCVNICSDNNFTDEDISKALMLAQENYTNTDGTGQIMDIQFLPFSLADSTNNNLQINSTALTAKFLDSDDFVFYTDLTDLTGINKETDTINIVSPSRASQFIFSPYNNDGIMEFQTSVTLRPFSTIIYVRPSTKGLLMYDFDDKDCLVIKEDFSLTKVTSAWAEYVRNNKNYESIFERQQTSRKVERSWDLKLQNIQKKYEDQTARAVSQERVKNYAGGGIIGRLFSPLGLLGADPEYLDSARMDRAYNTAMYQETMSLAQDMFDLQNENLKAQPSIPSKITIIDCKLLDGIYLEYWSTNNTEKEAIRSYYRFNGHRIDSYGTFRNYYGWFVSGKIIISNNYTQPEIEELNRRLELGIFTEVEYAE